MSSFIRLLGQTVLDCQCFAVIKPRVHPKIMLLNMT